jgi:nickel transport protein
MLVVFTASQVWAHKVNIFAYVDGETVYTESYFPDGTPVKEGIVEVLDTGKEKLLEGKTDQQGLFSFTLTKKEDLLIVINASMGHKNSYLLKESEM